MAIFGHKLSNMSEAPKKSGLPEITNVDGSAFEIPVEGSIGLLALGFEGIVAWRAKRLEVLGSEDKRPFSEANSVNDKSEQI